MANPNPILRSETTDWTKEELIYLFKNYADGSIIEICEHLSRTEKAVRMMAVYLEVKRANWYWNEADEKWLLKNYKKTLSAKEIGEKLGRSKWALSKKFGELTKK